MLGPLQPLSPLARRRGVAAALPFDPTTIAGLKLYVKASSGVWADAGKTIPASDGVSVACWADQSGNGADVFRETAGGPTLATISPGALVFDGTQSERSPSLAPLLLHAGLTFVARVKTTSAASSSSYGGNPALTVVGDPSGSVYLGFGVTAGKIQYRHYVFGWQITTGATSVNDGAWHEIAVTHDSSTGAVKIYVDGVADATSTVTYGTTNAQMTAIGSGYGGDRFVGSISSVEVYDTPLSAADIAKFNV